MGYVEHSVASFGQKDIIAQFQSNFIDGYRIIDWHIAKEKESCDGANHHVAYLAVECPNGEIKAEVVTYSLYTRCGEFLICEKGVPEEWEPCCCHCPKKILDRLSPTTDKWATEWRNRCRQNLDT